MSVKFTFILAATIFSLFCAGFAASQEKVSSASVETLPFPGQFMKREPEGNYLAPFLELKKREKDYTASEQWRDTFLTMISYADSFLGNYAEAIAYADEQQDTAGNAGNSKIDETSKFSLDNYRPRNAVDVIAKVAGKRQVIMINEYHHVPMNRALTTELLPILYKKGFRYLAVEAVNDFDSELNKRGYPIYKTGLYPAEPVFGNLLRSAIKLGIKVVPYEYREKCQPKPDNPNFCNNERERGQAQNIYDRILKNDPQAKILVHAGMGHVQEDVYSKELAIMAAHFKNISGIDPFTIDQTEMIEHSKAEYEEFVYKYATGRNLIKEPTIFESSDGNFWKKQPGQYSSVDAQIFHPRVKYENNRPVWLKLNGRRKAYIVDLRKLNLTKQRLNNSQLYLIQAFVQGESENAVPVDQVIAGDKKKPSVLMLPKKENFRVRAIDESGKIVGEVVVSL